MDEVVRVEAVRVERVPHPRPPDRDEEAAEDEEPVEGQVVRERERELRDGDDEDEVEAQLEPRRVAGAVTVLERSDPRRGEEA
jgi:hypothetical protein